MPAEFFLNDDNAPQPNKPNHIGAVAILLYDGMILIEQRSDSGKWAFIGGGLRIDESLEECISREIMEETGLETKKMQFMRIFSNPKRIAEYPDGNVLRIITCVYLAHVDSIEGLKKSEESLKLGFFKLNELPLLDFAETHKDILMWLIADENILQM